jgi:hypothetical protein
MRPSLVNIIQTEFLFFGVVFVPPPFNVEMIETPGGSNLVLQNIVPTLKGRRRARTWCPQLVNIEGVGTTTKSQM